MALKGRKLFLELDSEDYAFDIQAFTINHAEGNPSFGDRGHSEATIAITARQRMGGTDSLWQFQWDNHGEEVDFAYAPYGNETATAEEPHFTGTAIVGFKPTVGGALGEWFNWETEWQLLDDVEEASG